ncbi:hypothetical protein BC826DRAFT_280143 [Russula brevipes]|nr:hypothetical protein BC826DRAFT_280143 [Russula brevipes]
MKRDKRDEKPRLGHASKYINSSKEKDKDTPSKNKNNKPYAGEGGLKKLLARRKQEVIEAEPVGDPDVQIVVDDDEREPEAPKRTSKIAEPVRSPATFARKVSAPPPSSVPSFGVTGRKAAHLRTSRARTVGPTRTRNRFTAAYEDDELDGADDLATMPEEPLKEKESISASLPMFGPPSGFSFAPPPSVTSIPQASDTSSARDEPPISALPFVFSKPPLPKVEIPAGLQPPTIAFVPPTPEGPQADKAATEPAVPNFFSNSRIFARTGVTPPQSVSSSVSNPGPEPVSQAVGEPGTVSKPETGTTTPEPSAASVPPASTREAAAPAVAVPISSLETRKPSPAPFSFGPPPSTRPTPTQSSTGSSLPFSLTPSSAQLSKKDEPAPALSKSLFGGATTSFPGFGTSLSAPDTGTKPATQPTGVLSP